MNGVCSAQNIFVCKKHQPTQNTSNERKLIQQHRGVLRLQKLLGLVRAEPKAPLWGLPLPNYAPLSGPGLCGHTWFGSVQNLAWEWHHQLDEQELEQAPGVGDGQGSLGVLPSRGSQRVGPTEQLNGLTEPWSVLTPLLIRWFDTSKYPDWECCWLLLYLHSWEQETDEFNTVPGLVSLCLFFFISGSMSSGQESRKSHVIQNTPNKQKQGFQVHPLYQKISVGLTKGCMAGPITSVSL